MQHPNLLTRCSSPARSALPCCRRRDVFSCLQRDLPALNYTTPLLAWLEAFPREQIMLLQVGRALRCCLFIGQLP